VLTVQYLRIQGRDAVIERSDVPVACTVFIFRVGGPQNPAIQDHISKTQIVKIVKNTAVVTSNTELSFVKYSKYMLYKLLTFLVLNFSTKFMEAIPLCHSIHQGPCPLHLISLYLPLHDFCIDMSDDGLRKGRNMYRACKSQVK
jgi:hypothetical protein